MPHTLVDKEWDELMELERQASNFRCIAHLLFRQVSEQKTGEALSCEDDHEAVCRLISQFMDEASGVDKRAAGLIELRHERKAVAA